MANLCIKTPSSAIQVLIFQLLVLRPRPNLHSWLDGSGGSCGSVASDGSGWSGGLMSLLGLFGLVDLVCQLVWYFFGYFIAPKRIFKWKYCPK